ncbi:MAG: PQQ-binding-like beta-propeller repeat protein [Candidatus Glassbacteria bacterium]
MAKKKKKNLRWDTSRDMENKSGGFPDPQKLEEAAAWWRSSLRGGFSPAGAADHLAACLTRAGGGELTGVFKTLKELAAPPLTATGLSVPLKAAPSSALLDRESGRLFVADAALGGLECIGLETGRAIWEVEPGGAAQVFGMTVTDNLLVYCDYWQNRVVALDAADGACLWTAEEARDGKPLSAPADVAVVEVDAGRELWVAEYAGHRICRFALDGAPLGTIGRRGLSWEETSHRFTGNNNKPDQVYLEFPRSLDVGVDSSGDRAVFVWDWWNDRLQVLSPDGRRLRQIPLETPPGSRGRFAGTVRVVWGQPGPVILGIEDTTCSLLVWSPEGDLLINIRLADLLFSRPGRAERVRLCGRPSADCSIHLISTTGELYRLHDGILDSRRLLERLAEVYPDSAGIALDLAELPGGPVPGPNRKESSVRPGERELVESLVSVEDALSGRLERNVRRLAARVSDLGRAAGAESAARLQKTLEDKLSALAAGLIDQIERTASLDDSAAELGAEALTEVDMELFKNRGNPANKEVSLDPQIDLARAIPSLIRQTAWRLRVVLELIVDHPSAEPVVSLLSSLASACRRLLEVRIALLCRLDGSIAYDRDPQKVTREEIRQINLSTVKTRAIEKASGVLAEEIARLIRRRPELATPGIENILAGCAGLAAGLEAARIIGEALGAGGLHPAPEPKNEPVPARKDARGELKILVVNMQSYLDRLQQTAEPGGKFNKVLTRLKQIFAFKASLLSNYLPVNGFRGRETQKLIDRAREIAGEAWEESRSLRITAGREEHK